MHNLNFEIPIETLEDMFHIPTVREGDFPKSFNSNELWAHIPGETPYTLKMAKASRIQNIIFRYTHIVLAHTLFARGDITWNASLREIYLLLTIVNGYSYNVPSFLAK